MLHRSAPNDLPSQVEAYELAFADALQAQGYGWHLIPATSSWEDFEFPNNKQGRKSGSAKLNFGRDGVVIDRRRGNKPIFVWKGQNVKLTPEQQEELQRLNAERIAEVKRRQEKARSMVREAYPRYPNATADHPYLKAKGITNPFPLKLSISGGWRDPWLVIPMFSVADGELQTLQSIYTTGRKMYPKDSVTKGACIIPGQYGLDIQPGDTPIVISEGYATAEAVQRATGWISIAAMSCGNLKAIAEAIRERFPGRQIIIAADHDKSGAGLESANHAAGAVDGTVAIPLKIDTDFSDLLLSNGAEAVAQLIQNAVPAPEGDDGEDDANDNEGKGGGAAAAAAAASAQVEPAIAKMNETYALIIIGDSSAVMKTQGDEISFLKLDAFKQWHANQHITVGSKSVPLAQYWLTHPDRRQYHGLGFWPKSAPRKGYYNIWQGFSVKPVKGHCAKFLHHLKVNVCCRNKQHYRMVIGWMAQLIQEPEKKPGVALVIRGEQGTGKTKVGEVFGSLFQKHYVLVASADDITGKFNAHLRSALLLHADEAFWAGDHTAGSKLKDLITSGTQRIEFKGKEKIQIANYIRLLVTGNPDWLIPAELGDRRHFVLDIGEEHLNDFPYFAAIDQQMDNGGREALLYHLLHIDLSGINLRDVPKTKALLDQQTASMTPEQGWWFDTLSRGRLPYGCDVDRRCSTEALFAHYLAKTGARGVRRKALETQIGMFLHKYAPGIRNAKGDYVTPDGVKEYGKVYDFPELKECRAAFANKMRQAIDWDEPEADWDKEPEPVRF
jgi:phage/plasmid primase-like uncharacterized protein